MRYKFCPQCAFPVDVNKGEADSCPEGTQYCPVCGFIHWENPVPVAAALVPLYGEFDNKSQPPGGVLVVKRGVQPFKGGWCLPCGFVGRNERPKDSARREVFEETGVNVRMSRLLTLCTPPDVNQLVAFYLGRLVEEDPKPVAGDDAVAVGIYYNVHRKVKNLKSKDYELTDLCFSTHQQIVDDFMNCEIARLGDDYELKVK